VNRATKKSEERSDNMKMKCLLASLFLASLTLAGEPCIGIPETVRVVDGDTVDITFKLARCGSDDGQPVDFPPQRIRLIGVDTPERGEDGYMEATSFTHKWVSEKGFVVAFAVDKKGNPRTDKYGRMLAVLSEYQGGDGVFFSLSLNATIIKEGHGKQMIVKSRSKEIEDLTSGVVWATMQPDAEPKQGDTP